MHTISAAANAGHNVTGQPLTYLNTGLTGLDKLLGGQNSELGGVSQGQVTEIWGPSGAGKTALG